MTSVLAAAIAAAAAAAPSHAAVSITTFTLTPSTAAAAANPDVTVDVKLSSTGTDSIKDATLALASGLVANPSAAATCSATNFAADTCPAASKIGDGSIAATAIPFDTPVSLPIGVYLIAPQGAEVARVGVIAELFDFPVASMTAPITVRTSPDVGLDIPLTNIPNQTDSTSIQVNELMLHLFASVNGHPFTHNPTSCSPADTTLTIDSYGDPTQQTQHSSFTPTDCSSLGYAPKLTADATVDAHDDGLAFTAHLTQRPGDATTRSVTLTLPHGVEPRVGTLLAGCTAPDPANCPPIGSASVTSPLLPATVRGKLVLVSTGSGLPNVEAIFGPPLSLTLHGTTTLTPDGPSATFDSLPDVPITALDVSFAGGANSAFVAGATLCTQPQTLRGDFTATNGATAHLVPHIVVSGSCTAGTPAAKPTARVTLRGFRTGRPKVLLTVTAAAGAPALRALGIKLPRGLSVAKPAFPRGLAATLDGRKLTPQAWSRKHGLTVKLPSKGGRVAKLTIAGPTLTLGSALRHRLGHNHRLRLALRVSVTDATGAVTRLRPSAAASS